MAKEADPRSEWSALRAELEGGQLAPAYVLRGQERWFRESALEAVLDLARKKGLELCRHDARDPDFRLQSLLDDLTGFAMFASARCVAIAEPEALLKKTAGEESPLVRAMRSFVSGARGTLVLTADSLRSDLAIVKELVAAGAVLKTFRKLYDRPAPWERDPDPRRTELVGWLVQRAKERGVALTPDQAVLLTHSQGNDLSALDSQLQAAASGGATAALAGLSSSAAGSPAQVADGLISGDMAGGVLAIETLFRGGMRRERDGARETDDGALVSILLGYLRPRVRAGLAAAEAIERGASAQDAATEAGISGYDRTLRETIEKRNPRQWRTMLDDLLALERSSRRGGAVDANHFARLALKWGRRPVVRSGARAR